ncbi:TfdA family taurine catabolism dioxygenase TauD [Apiospora hydei]|uniref:TfdA family taurine catabolism dioxygenase TauD n=1 Tax=Apiospora hydei TaxID=1337664 RepID=A0ABR1X058_9PEZI
MSTTTTTTVTDTTPAAPAPPGQPDIAYAPDHQKWQARAARRLASETLPTAVPRGLPQPALGRPRAFSTNKSRFSPGFVIGPPRARDLPLPALHAELRRLSRELHTGHGFFVLRGLRVDDYSREENAIIYAGVSSHIAAQRGRQDHKFVGQPADVVLTHIKDLRGDKIAAGGAIGSPAYTTDRQVFHTDSGDIVSLFALETAASGGASKLASTWRVYNEIARTRPDLIHVLCKNWDYEVFEKADKQWTERPLMFYSEATDSRPERIALQYARRYFVGFGALPRSPDIPPISEAQAEALDTLHFLGDKFCVNTDFQKGDMQYVNNLAVFHARDAFTDSPEKKRHLLRLWLRDPENAWETPEVLRPRWAQLYDGITPESQIFPLEPYIRSAGNKGR